jgi:hypothetical protein
MNVILAKYVTLDCAEYLQDQTTPFSRYTSTFHFLHTIINLEKFISVKTTSKKKNAKETSKRIGAELSSPNGIAKKWSIAKRLFGDSISNAHGWERGPGGVVVYPSPEKNM